MKTLILMRHAKSSWNSDDMADHARPLSGRGRDATPKMGTWLKKARLKPEILLCSTATRVQETAELIRPYLPKALIQREHKRLYMALPREILSEIGKIPDEVGTLMVLGHNPGIGSLAHWLAGQGDKPEMARLAEKFPTAAIAVLDFDVETWREVDGEGGTLRHFATPKDED